MNEDEMLRKAIREAELVDADQLDEHYRQRFRRKSDRELVDYLGGAIAAGADETCNVFMIGLTELRRRLRSN